MRRSGRRDVTGKPKREAFPELEGQGLFELLDQVYSTGEPHVGVEKRVLIDRRGAGDLDEKYFN